VRKGLQQTAPVICGLAASGLLLSLIQPPLCWSILAVLAYVPFGLACRSAVGTKRLAWMAYLVAAVYWMVNLYWIAPITIAGWIALCLYMAILWPIMAIALRYCASRQLPASACLAIIVTGAERLQGFPLGGFYWRLLGHSQFLNPTIIQIADIFGAGGVSFLLALVNGLLIEVITWRRSKARSVTIQAAAVLLLLALAFGYGRWRLGQATRSSRPGPIVACLQSNVPQSVKRTFKASDQIFSELLDMGSSVAEDSDLLIWPETSVQAILDSYLWPMLDEESAELGRRYDLALRRQARDYKCHIMVGAYGGRVSQQPDGQWVLDRFNSAFLYRPDGTADPARYDKIHLVLFGEYLPFKHSFHWLYRLLMQLTPYNYDYSLEPGKEHTIFAINPAKGASGNFRLAVLICYEDTIPALARRAVLDSDEHKRVDGIVNISNDGWFVRFLPDQERVRSSTELAQHLAACVFRAVENRVCVARAVNTGISCLIDPCGRILDGGIYCSPSMPSRALSRTGVAGVVVDRMAADGRITPFSRFGQWLDNLCAVALIAIIVLSRFLAKISGKGS